jgi:anion-transporting  ArsA/GET3 family ATPase
MKHRYLLLFALLPVTLALVILIPRLKADTSPQKANPKAMAELVEVLKIWKLINAVSPTAEQHGPLLMNFNELEKVKTQYRRQHRQAMDRLKQLKDVEIDSEAKRAEFKAALAHLQELESTFIDRRNQITEDINQFLTLEQQVKFRVFSDSYHRDLRKTLQTLIALQNLSATGKLKERSLE